MIGLLIALVILVLVVWAAKTVLPLLGLPQPLQTVLYVAVVVVGVIWLLGQLRAVL